MTDLRNRWTRWAYQACVILGLAALATPAEAVPSFARQTGMACEACHTVWPELTHFGRVFKANGYILDNLKQVRSVSPRKDELLSLASLPPLSMMVQISDTQLSKPLPDAAGGTTQNGSVAFPQQVSLFYAGKIAPHGGAFIQLTYAHDNGGLQIDNTDIRFADIAVTDGGQSIVYGVSLNNNPTVQDLFNSTPAFGFPYAASSAAPGSPFGTQIDGALAQNVAGLTGYVYLNESLYAEAGFYRSAQQRSLPLDSTATAVLSGLAPYWRLAYEHNWDRHSLSGGVYGATFKMFPGGGKLLGGPTDEYRDVAADVQYQYAGDNQLFSLQATRISENATLNATYQDGAGSSNLNNKLTTTRAFATYYYERRIGGTAGVFQTTGTGDAILHTPAGLNPDPTASPDTSGWMAEVNYLPWMNTKFSAQYTAYSKYNGRTNDILYDGSGRSARDNSTLYLLAWFAF
jgi:hypothetical protein